MKIKSLFNPKFLLWFFGIFFALGSLVYVKESPIASASFFLLTILTLPPLSNVLPLIIKKPINKSLKLIIGFLLFLVAIKFTPPTDNPNKPSIQGTFAAIISTSTVTPTSFLSVIPTTNSNLVKVTKEIDGDTFMIKISGKEMAVRLIGMDTPETVDPRKPVQCFGREASAKAKELIEGKDVILDSDPTQGDKDKYGRLLRYVHLEDGTFFNQKLIEEGYAFEYTYDIPYKYQTEFKEAQKQAEVNKKGLWADGACPIVQPTSPPKPTSPPAQTDIKPSVSNSPSGSWTCNCSKGCGAISSCEEAYYQLNTCGCSVRDADHDGIPCESLCN